MAQSFQYSKQKIAKRNIVKTRIRKNIIIKTIKLKTKSYVKNFITENSNRDSETEKFSSFLELVVVFICIVKKAL